MVEHFITWLNHNAGLLSLVFSFFVTASTVAYVALTRRLVQETIAMRKVETEPRVAVYLELNREHVSAADMVIRNIGNGPAYDVRFTVESSHTFTTPDALTLQTLPVFRGIRFLAPGVELRFYFGLLTTILNDLVLSQPTTITVQYSGSGGTEHPAEIFVIDPNQFRDLPRLLDQPIPDMAKALKTIAKNVDAAVSAGESSSRLNVRVQTAREARRDLDRMVRDVNRQNAAHQLNAPGAGLWRRMQVWLDHQLHR